MKQDKTLVALMPLLNRGKNNILFGIDCRFAMRTKICEFHAVKILYKCKQNPEQSIILIYWQATIQKQMRKNLFLLEIIFNCQEKAKYRY